MIDWGILAVYLPFALGFILFFHALTCLCDLRDVPSFYLSIICFIIGLIILFYHFIEWG